MRPIHALLAVLVAAVWGSNFVFVKFGLREMSPFLLCTLRFLLVSVPIVLFIPKPNVPFRQLACYSLFGFAIQFLLLFLGLQYMSAGLSSILLQVQVFFSIFLAAVFLKEKLTKLEITGALVAFSGLGLIGLNIDHGTSMLGFILEIGCAASWAASNLVTKKMTQVNPFSLVAWGCLLSTPPMLIISLIVDGPQQILFSLQHVSWLGIASIAYISYVSTWFGYGVWNDLLHRYSMSNISPFALLVPVFGMVGSALVLDEPMEPWKLHAAYIIILGLSINLFGPKLLAYYRTSKVALYSE